MLTSSAVFAGPAWTRENDAPDLTLILLADLHSGYAYTAGLLAAVREAVRERDGKTPVRIIINGDVFEGGNVLAQRGDGVIDFAFLKELANLAPLIVTIGNHDSDLFDPAEFVERTEKTGAQVLSDMTDPRTGKPYGKTGLEFRVGDRLVRAAAAGTPNLATYPEKYRADYAIPAPAEHAAKNFAALLDGADLRLALVHARLSDDRVVLPFAGNPCILYGGHEHLRFTQPEGANLHLQSGAWSNCFAIVDVQFKTVGAAMRSRDVVIAREAAPDHELARFISNQRDALLTPPDLRPLGRLPQSLPLEQAVLFAAQAVRDAAGADVGFLGHTTFGDGLPAGPVTPLDLAAFVRFDGGIATAEVDGETLVNVILPRTNQYGDFPYAKRIGDFLHATPIDPKPGKRYRIAVNAYSAMPAARRLYFGIDEMQFSPVEKLALKSVIVGALPPA